jgi:hypothetical protein
MVMFQSVRETASNLQGRCHSLLRRVAISLPFRALYSYWAWFPWNRWFWTPEEASLPLKDRRVPLMFWPWATVAWLLVLMAVFATASALYHALTD